MAYKMINNCPVCSKPLRVVRLKCPHCKTVVEGDFETERLLSLNAQQQSFVLSFLKNRGNIREMEKELGISYPTVRARLDEILAVLDGEPGKGAKRGPSRKEILELLANGDITQEEAQQMLTRK